MDNKKPAVALLIDADNLSPAAVEAMFLHLQDRGLALPVRHAHGGHEKLAGMKEVLKRHAIRAFVNQGKGTTDVALVIDAMDLLRDGALPEAVAIGSSDADFAPLALRLREAGKHVMCFAQDDKAAADELACAYDNVVYVGEAPTKEGSVAGVAKARRAPAKKASTVKTVAKAAAPAKKAAAKKAPAPAKRAVAKAAASAPVEVQHILDAVPGLAGGQAQSLNSVVNLLHNAKLLGKNTASTKLFKKFPAHFELTPPEQPNQVRYLLP